MAPDNDEKALFIQDVEVASTECEGVTSMNQSMPMTVNEAVLDCRPNLIESGLAQRVIRTEGNRAFMRIRADDSLMLVAEEMFGNRMVAHLIADLNAKHARTTMRDGKRIVKFRQHQEIMLPLERELADFLHYMCHAQIEVVTVVDSTRTDLAKLSANLNPVVCPRPWTPS